ncbi:MAG TPA: hypothetical protein VK907_12935 [Phnomibacter sp.]|nr:hypothetical protein [Phnomibacter sp.]
MKLRPVAIIAMFILGPVSGAIAQNVGINGSGAQPHSSAMLDVSSTTKGLLVPRMTTLQRNGIANPAKGLLVYDTDLNNLFHFNGTTWSAVGAGGGNGFALPYDGTIAQDGIAFRVANSGSAIEGQSHSSTGVNAISVSGTALNALSSTGFGIVATSVGSTALYAFSNNQFPTVRGVNSNASGVGVQGNSGLHHGVLGTSGGTSKAGVRGEATGTSGIGVFGTSASETGVGVYGNVSSGTAVYGFSNTGVGVKAFSSSGLALEVIGNLKISGGNTTPAYGAVLTSDANGNASWKNNRIAFKVSGIHNDLKGLASNTRTRVHFATEAYDYGNNYFLHVGSNPGTTASTFTAPAGGVYHFDVAARVGSAASGNDLRWADISLMMNRNGVISVLARQEMHIDPYFNIVASGNISVDVKLQTGDRVYVEVLQYNGGGSGVIDGSTTSQHIYFGGHLLFFDQ